MITGIPWLVTLSIILYISSSRYKNALAIWEIIWKHLNLVNLEYVWNKWILHTTSVFIITLQNFILIFNQTFIEHLCCARHYVLATCQSRRELESEAANGSVRMPNHSGRKHHVAERASLLGLDRVEFYFWLCYLLIVQIYKKVCHLCKPLLSRKSNV